MRRGQRRQINKSIIARDAENRDREVPLLPGMVIEVIQERWSDVHKRKIVVFGLVPGEAGNAVTFFAIALTVFRNTTLIGV